ncbi:hypothetical protein [Dictyobacter kobayashii]|uniref:DUF3592 domain-containing protein n=1 Tax=Dictyobacter kobayashii TaxID=2014872 RepID=A0A402APL8_9CHLR|nr:hypothetical protein [Dictyobacter kobayashii]GCE21042.1 hypothetical protein KDK_48420 [Dictyobacter kobayashii]
MYSLILLVGLLCLPAALLIIVKQREHYRIRQSGIRVMARIIQVNSWQEPAETNGVLGQMNMIPQMWMGGPKWGYEIIAVCTDPSTHETYTLSSGRKKGLASYRRGEYLPAYISSKGNYLEIS